MNKLEFITRQFSRAEKKRYEHYVVTRIWHLIDDTSIKFVTQQYVSRPEGRALTDMYFPQLQIHIEIDEGHHKKQIEADIIREADIINATGHELMRVDVTKDLEEINKQISDIAEFIKLKKSLIRNFKVWDLDVEFNPETYITKGFINIDDDCSFKTMVDAANCFGNNYKPKGIWNGGAKHPKEYGKIIWFPKLYKNKDWNNSISNDETEIREISTNSEFVKKHIDDVSSQNLKRIVFARVKSPLGDIMYRFKGEYELDREKTNYKDGLLWKRISKEVKTYRNK